MINIPDDRASSNCIRIEGNKEGVSMAKVVSDSTIDKKKIPLLGPPMHEFSSKLVS